MRGLSANYVTKQKELLARLLGPEESAATTTPTSAKKAFDEKGLESFLEELSDFDEAMNDPPIDAKILAGACARLHSVCGHAT